MDRLQHLNWLVLGMYIDTGHSAGPLDQACCISKHRARGEMGNQRQGNHICTSVYVCTSVDCRSLHTTFPRLWIYAQPEAEVKLKHFLFPFRMDSSRQSFKVVFLNVSSHHGYAGEKVLKFDIYSGYNYTSHCRGKSLSVQFAWLQVLDTGLPLLCRPSLLSLAECCPGAEHAHNSRSKHCYYETVKLCSARPVWSSHTHL